MTRNMVVEEFIDILVLVSGLAAHMASHTLNGVSVTQIPRLCECTVR